MQRMGHSTMRAALIYQHATNERAREIADRLNAVVERETKAGDGGTPDDEDGAAGSWSRPLRARVPLTAPPSNRR
jgi:hypothetical protein